jgi:hypothetical protein
MNDGINLKNMKLNNITNANFKYIHFHFRREWIKLLYPHMTKFLEAIVNIPWASYCYEGPAYFTYESLDENTGEISTEYKTFVVEVKGLNYNLFGGSVAEVLNYAYREESGINLRDYVDPTGDFDVSFFYKTLVVKNDTLPDDDKYTIVYNPDNTISPLIDDMTQWVFDQFYQTLVRVVQKYEIQRLEIDTVKTYPLPSLPETCKSNLNCRDDDPLFLSKTVGDYTVIRKTEPDMIKIQLAINIQTRDANNIMEKNQYTDHLIEFVLTTKSDVASNLGGSDQFMNKMITVQNINIQSPDTWISSQMRGYNSRKRIFEEKDKHYLLNKHKIINHVKRVEYILAMTIFLDTKYPKTLSDIKYYINHVTDYEEAKDAMGMRIPKIIMIQTNQESRRSVPLKVYFKKYIDAFDEYERQKEEKRQEEYQERRRRYAAKLKQKYEPIKPKLVEKLKTNKNYKNRFIASMKERLDNDEKEITDTNIENQLKSEWTYDMLSKSGLLKNLNTPAPIAESRPPTFWNRIDGFLARMGQGGHRKTRKHRKSTRKHRKHTRKH